MLHTRKRAAEAKIILLFLRLIASDCSREQTHIVVQPKILGSI